MSVFVTGATGFIGVQLVRRLVGSGTPVHALYRSEARTGPIRMDGVTLFQGDILDPFSIRRAMEGCGQVYHTAAFAGTWARDPDLIRRLNVDGTLHVINAAEELNVRRVVVTSTAGILGPSHGEPVHEGSPPPSSFFTPYEESKFLMESSIMKRDRQLPEVVIVNPTRVYGPGIMNISNSLTRMVCRYLDGRWRFIPGNGESTGNYVFVEDVVSGHLLAMEKGRPGERYVLGGENITYNQLFEMVRQVSGIRKGLVKIPYWAMISTATLFKIYTAISGRPPLVLPQHVRKYNHNWLVSSDKAIRELGYDPVGFRSGIGITIQWFYETPKNQAT